MTSDPDILLSDEVFVWCWLPDQPDPVVVGRLYRDGSVFSFNYGQSWLKREDAFPLYLPELPLQAGRIAPLPALDMASCLRDGAPDAWGRRVILNHLAGKGLFQGQEIDELTLLLHSGSDRIGNLDFQLSASQYVLREMEAASLEELQLAADLVERGEPIIPALDCALFHGSSIGGARPKALIDAPGRKMIAKFSSSTDTYSVVKAEFIAMRQPLPGLIHHCERGSQYCSYEYRNILSKHGIIASMSGKGNCYDNSMVETVFKTIKNEMVWRTGFQTRKEATYALGKYIEGFYNPIRRHSALGYKSPNRFEKNMKEKEKVSPIKTGKSTTSRRLRAKRW